MSLHHTGARLVGLKKGFDIGMPIFSRKGARRFLGEIVQFGVTVHGTLQIKSQRYEEREGQISASPDAFDWVATERSGLKKGWPSEYKEEMFRIFPLESLQLLDVDSMSVPEKQLLLQKILEGGEAVE